MPISRDQIEALSKQVFIVEYLLNGMFPCQSDVVRLIRSKKREWKFSDKFEYRMLLAGTNTGGSLNSQTFRENVGMIKKGDLEYGTFRATYGTVSDGFDVDMTLNLETNDKKVAFENDFATRMHACSPHERSFFVQKLCYSWSVWCSPPALCSLSGWFKMARWYYATV